MNDTERDSQLSAMFDGELPAGECELLARRLARDPRLKRQWASYSLIGAVIRNEPLQAGERARSRQDSRLSRRVAEAIAQDPASDAPDAAAAQHAIAAAAAPGWQRPAVGLGIAAAVAAIAVFGLQMRGAVAPAGGAEPALLASAGYAAGSGAAGAPTEEVVIPAVPAPEPQAAGGDGTEPESYVVPAAVEPRGVSGMPPPQLANFMVAHSEYSAPWARRNLLASILASEATAEVPPVEAAAGPADVVDPAAGVERR